MNILDNYLSIIYYYCLFYNDNIKRNYYKVKKLESNINFYFIENK